ncbi:MAG: rRNA pseudouridine synthase [Proteobacteria bacterium]|nr:rRNA pseudouridine synthase [Pseudomonadota bacterium]
MIRLQKAIAHAGITSRRKAEDLIRQGLVKVNGHVITELGTQVDPATDNVKVSNKVINLSVISPIIYALYKPKSCVCTLDDPQGRSTIVEFFPKTRVRLFPVGRLDYDAEGLVLLTNDGDLAHKLMHPSKHIWKTYLVKLKGKIKLAELNRLKKGPLIEGEKKQPIKAKFLHFINDKSWVEVSLQEGIKHHIKKMFAEIRFPVLKIKRISIGSVTLEELTPGKCRQLTPEEIKTLLSLGG